MHEFSVIDFYGDEWTFAKRKFVRQANGFWKMWAWVLKGPPSLTTGVYAFQELPFPVFTEWFE